MPKKPKLKFSHTQAGGKEIFFKDKKGSVNEMFSFFDDKPKRKTKRGTWSLGLPLIFKKK